MHRIYLDDIRTPVDKSWVVARSYENFVSTIETLGLENIELITLDHDLGDSAMAEYFNNVDKNFELNYNNIKEKTGLDCAKYLVDQWMQTDIKPCQVYTHSANPVGSANIMGYINAYLMHVHLPQSCVRVRIEIEQ